MHCTCGWPREGRWGASHWRNLANMKGLGCHGSAIPEPVHQSQLTICAAAGPGRGGRAMLAPGSRRGAGRALLVPPLTYSRGGDNAPPLSQSTARPRSEHCSFRIRRSDGSLQSGHRRYRRVSQCAAGAVAERTATPRPPWRRHALAPARSPSCRRMGVRKYCNLASSRSKSQT